MSRPPSAILAGSNKYVSGDQIVFVNFENQYSEFRGSRQELHCPVRHFAISPNVEIASDQPIWMMGLSTPAWSGHSWS